MKFTKMHGLGNDYVYIDTFTELVDDPSTLARVISNRHTGVGSDGLILIGPSRAADVRMVMYNADGSRAQMCGNGLRCVAKYAVERGLTRAPELRIETDAGVKLAECRLIEGLVRSVRIDMGIPQLSAAAIPATIPEERIVDCRLSVGDHQYIVTCISMGNPHAVVFVDALDAVALEVVGPQFEHAPEFPERINAHFAAVDSPSRVLVKTWERGSGATRACGTGACAVCVAGVLTGRTLRRIGVNLPGGELQVEWASDDHVYLTGPAEEVFTGDWPNEVAAWIQPA